MFPTLKKMQVAGMYPRSCGRPTTRWRFPAGPRAVATEGPVFRSCHRRGDKINVLAQQTTRATKAMADLRELEEAIAIAESAIDAGLNEVRQQTGADPATFDRL